MRTYELVLVFDPALEVEQIDVDLRKLSDMISVGGQIRKWERWGKRRLAYEIAGRQYGYYVLTVFDAEPSAINEIDRTIRINASVIRHLVSVVDLRQVPEPDLESVRTLGAAPEVPVQAKEEAAEVVEGEAEVGSPVETPSADPEIPVAGSEA